MPSTTSLSTETHKLTPLTFSQAVAISGDYQPLIGSLFEKGVIGKGCIECIAPAPYEESKQWLFGQYYKELKDPVKALQFYKGPEYTVVALSIPVLRKRGILYRDLRSYLAENDIPFYNTRYFEPKRVTYGSYPRQ